MQFRRSVGIATLATVLAGGSQRAEATRYIFATFKGDDAAGMKLSIYTSTDSINFTLLSDTGFGGNTTYIRDPSIMKHTDGKYYIAYTDPMKASCCNPEDHFGIASSADLIHWTDLTTVKAGVPNVSRVWAPEWYVEGDVVRVIANIDTGNADFQPYVFAAQDSTLSTWSGPTKLGIGTDYIDTYVAKLGTTYHAFIKSETTRYLEHATASGLTGPWTFVGKNDWAGWGSGMEGPAIVRLDDGTFRLYVDPQAGGQPCQTMTSADLNTWSARTGIPGAAGLAIRHGTVIRDEAGPGSNGYFSAAGGTPATGGASGAGGATGAGGSTGTGGFLPKGGTLANGGITAVAGGTVSLGGASMTGGSLGAGGTDGGAADANGGGGRGRLDASTTGGAGGENTTISAGGATDTGGASVGRGGTTAPDTGNATGGVLQTGGAATLATGGSGGRPVATGGNAAGGTTEPIASADAGTLVGANSSGCSCTVNRGSSSKPTPAWLFLGLVGLFLHARRRR